MVTELRGVVELREEKNLLRVRVQDAALYTGEPGPVYAGLFLYSLAAAEAVVARFGLFSCEIEYISGRFRGMFCHVFLTFSLVNLSHKPRR